MRFMLREQESVCSGSRSADAIRWQGCSIVANIFAPISTAAVALGFLLPAAAEIDAFVPMLYFAVCD